MIISGRFKYAGDGDGRPLLFEESYERRNSFFGIDKHLVDRPAILPHARDVELCLADIDPDTLCLDPASVKSKLSPRTSRITSAS